VRRENQPPVGLRSRRSCRYVTGIAWAGNTCPDPKELAPEADMAAVADGQNGRATEFYP